MLKEYGNCTGPFGFPMQEEDARELDSFLEIHSKDSALTYKRTVNPVALDYFIEKEHADVSTVTDGSVDKDREIVDPNGVDWSGFAKNPIVTLGHNYHLLPVGKSIWWKQVGDAWKAKTIYAARPDSLPTEKEWVPDTIWHMVKAGIVNGKSIGFLPISARQPTTDEVNKTPALSKVRAIFDKVKVLEYAVATIQANDNAVVEMVNKGIIKFTDEQLLKEFATIKIQRQEQDIKVKGLLAEDYEQIVRHKIESRLEELNLGMSSKIDDIFARILGKV